MTIAYSGDNITFPDASVQNTAPKAGMINRIINGGMVVDQRNAGASVTPTANNTYIVDRWSVNITQASKFSIQQKDGLETGASNYESGSSPAGFKNSLKVTSASSYSVAVGDVFTTRQPIEGLNLADLAWGTANAASVTLSFWVKSSLTGTFGGALQNSSVSRSYPFSYTISAANTWEQKLITIAGDTSGTWLTTNGVGVYVGFGLGVGSTYSGTAGTWAGADYRSATGATSVVGTSGATFYITGVQLEAGSVATPFERRFYGQELQLAQRYYWRTTGDDFAGIGAGTVRTSTAARAVIVNPTPMRAKPSISIAGSLGGSAGGAVLTITTIAAAWSGVVSSMTEFYVSGATTGQGFIIHHLDNTSNYFQCDAEL